MFDLAKGLASDMFGAGRRPAAVARRDLSGMTVVFTGATDGMGRVAAMRLAEMGASLFVLGRDSERTGRTVEVLNRRSGAERSFAIACDLASLASVRACAAELLEACPRIDLLINCAGMNTRERRLSADGYELIWAVNYLGPFLLTDLLLDRLRASAPARIVNLSSATERSGRIKFDDLQHERGWTLLKAYAQAKLATNMATIALARRLEGSGVTVNALNPGFIRTALLRDFRGAMRFWQLFMRWFASPPEVGAERILRLALAPEYEGISGRFVFEDEIRPPNKEALDDTAVERLWRLSHETVRS